MLGRYIFPVYLAEVEQWLDLSIWLLIAEAHTLGYGATAATAPEVTAHLPPSWKSCAGSTACAEQAGMLLRILEALAARQNTTRKSLASQPKWRCTGF